VKSLRISDDAHEKLTTLLGELTAQTKVMQTYTDAIETLLKKSVILPPELIGEVDEFVKGNKSLGYTTKEEFVRDAVRHRLKMLRNEYQMMMEIPKEEYEKANQAVKEMNTPYLNAADFIYDQIKELLNQYEEWKETQKEL